MKKIVGFVGSPRIGGNTEALVEKVLTGAMAAGAETELYRLNELNIKGCQGCNHCQEHGYCCQKDDMTLLYEQLKTADGFVLGSPIYMGYFSAQTKLFLDRMYAFLKVGLSCHLPPGKRCVLVYSQGRGDNVALVENLARWFESRLGVHVKGIVGGNNMNELGAVRQRKELLETAYHLGKELVV
ncbi:MAG: flavodoxin family protein [Tissierellia bacterium]|nr:flavodoxin family protein [Tissierellia bacterium]